LQPIIPAAPPVLKHYIIGNRRQRVPPVYLLLCYASGLADLTLNAHSIVAQLQ
jgi:hypothetical protein